MHTQKNSPASQLIFSEFTISINGGESVLYFTSTIFHLIGFVDIFSTQNGFWMLNPLGRIPNSKNGDENFSLGSLVEITHSDEVLLLKKDIFNFIISS